MKKALMILLVLTCLLGLVGCDPRTNQLPKDEVLANTVKIELVYYENKNPELLNIRRTRGEKPHFDFNKATVMATLDESHFKDLLNEVTDTRYTFYGTSLNEPMGKTLILYQSNGNMIVLFGCVYKNEKGGTRYYGDCNIFDENGVFIEHIGDVGYLFSDRIEATYFQNNP